MLTRSPGLGLLRQSPRWGVQQRRSAVAAAPVPNIVTDGLVAWYRLNEGSGQTVNDSSGNGYHVTLGSTTGVDVNDPEWTADGLLFDPTTNIKYVPITALWPAFPTNNGPFTIQVVLTPADLTGQQEIVDMGDGANGIVKGFRLLHVAGVPYGQIMDGSTRHSINSGTLTVDEKTSLTFSWDGTTKRLYKDALPLTSATGGTWITHTAARIGIQSSTNTGAFNGTMHEVLFYDRALTQSDIEWNEAAF